MLVYIIKHCDSPYKGIIEIAMSLNQ